MKNAAKIHLLWSFLLMLIEKLLKRGFCSLLYFCVNISSKTKILINWHIGRVWDEVILDNFTSRFMIVFIWYLFLFTLDCNITQFRELISIKRGLIIMSKILFDSHYLQFSLRHTGQLIRFLSIHKAGIRSLYFRLIFNVSIPQLLHFKKLALKI